MLRIILHRLYRVSWKRSKAEYYLDPCLIQVTLTNLRKLFLLLLNYVNVQKRTVNINIIS